MWSRQTLTLEMTGLKANLRLKKTYYKKRETTIGLPFCLVKNRITL
jgi:hypothetical protein